MKRVLGSREQRMGRFTVNSEEGRRERGEGRGQRGERVEGRGERDCCGVNWW
jgi:hypothetical protein